MPPVTSSIANRNRYSPNACYLIASASQHERKSKRSRLRLKYAVGLAVLALLLMTTVAYASGGPPRLGGRWVTTDQVDGSTINLTLAGPPGGPFKVRWTESYFTLCDSRFGRGRGTAELIAPNTLSMIVDFECFHNSNAAHFKDVLIYDPGSRVLDSTSKPDDSGVDFFVRPGAH